MFRHQSRYDSRHDDCPDAAARAPAERAARQHVRRVRGFYQHLLVFVLVSLGLAALDLLGGPGRLWFHWPLLGWSVWLALHAVRTFVRGAWLGPAWEEAKVRERLAGKR